MSEIVQLYGELLGLPLQQAQADAASSQDAEPEFRCPRCECETEPAEICGYCEFDLYQWARDLTQANSIKETMQEMRNGG